MLNISHRYNFEYTYHIVYLFTVPSQYTHIYIDDSMYTVGR